MLADTRSRQAWVIGQAACRARRLRRPVLASWTEPSSEEAISFFARAAGTTHRALWLRPSSGEAVVGVGAARTLTGTGHERFRQVDRAWRDLLAEAVMEDGLGQPYGGPVLLGGFSFDPLRAQGSGLWCGFPDARLVLPERMLVVSQGAAWLTRNVVVLPEDGCLRQEQPPEPERTPSPDGADGMLSQAQWQSLVGAVARGIADGQLGVDKIVLARAQQVQQPHAMDPQLAVRNLAQRYPGCTIFAITHANACFLGATPERLVALRNGTASTLALAGSSPRGATPSDDQRLAEQLLHDPKERAEHAIVVTAVREALAQVCSRVISDTQPTLKKLANVQHLLTSMRARVAPGTSILELVERLHPTPAVGGFPTQRALDLIRQHEALDRGWYAGPIGWVNRDGEGEFVVAIRSALLRGNSATLFAGCGIVADSDPATEFAESGWKLQPMLAALGAGK
ncbi:MAG: isochorismate synthase [Chloroflexota bacterium]